MVAKFILFFGVLFFSYLQTATMFKLKRHLKALRHRAELKKEYPGFGKDYVFTVDQHGELKRLDLHGGQIGDEIYQHFLKSEEQSEKQNTGVSPFALFDLGVYSSIPDKFNFNRSDINFILFNRDNKDGINLTNNFDFSKYDGNKLTKLVTHGFTSSGSSPVCVTIKANYLEVEDVNVIILDWGPIAANVIYPITAAATSKVAHYTASFLAYLIRRVGVSDEDVHLIGHSLGAHVMGFTGKYLIIDYKIKIARITGLDPAGPLFKMVHINKKDADFVDIIHTNGDFLGLNDSIGHVDFYPNNGDSPQPGCEDEPILRVDSCSHGKSWEYFAESIKEANKYIGNCTDENKHPMGARTSPNARGICSLDTGTNGTNGTNGVCDNSKRGFDLFGTIDRFIKKIADCIRGIFR